MCGAKAGAGLVFANKIIISYNNIYNPVYDYE